MQGRRVEWASQILAPGEYAKLPDGTWHAATPNGHRSQAGISPAPIPLGGYMSAGITQSYSGTGSDVLDKSKSYGQQFSSTDGENDSTKAARRQAGAATAAIEKIVEGKESSQFSVTVSGSHSDGGSGYLNISYSETPAPAAPAAPPAEG